MLKRRHFLGSFFFAALGFQSLPSLKLATLAQNSNQNSNELKADTYHIFVPHYIAKTGGIQQLTLRSGDITSIKIPQKLKEKEKIYISTKNNNQYDSILIFHSLYDPKTPIIEPIFNEIKNTDFLCDYYTKLKCQSVYNKLKEGLFVEDITTLELLDYIVESSNLENEIKERYKLASQNSYIVGIKEAIESALQASELDQNTKQLLRGTYEYVRASEPVPNFKALKDLDAIVNGSTLPMVVKQHYAVASAISRAYTADVLIINYIFKSGKQDRYLEVYEKLRDGKSISESEQTLLNELDKLLKNATESDPKKLPNNAYAVYKVVRQEAGNLKNKKIENDQDRLRELYARTNEVREQARKSKNWGEKVVPLTTQVLTTVGAEAGTGATISSLSGAAATNATLAWLGGGSVATGGLGMLGGLTIATGGAALIGAAGLLSVALVADMDAKDFQNLGVALGTGAIAGAATIYTAWTAATVFGVAEGLAGAAYISSMIAALGGINIMTGGAAMIASGVAFVIWYTLKDNKKRDWSIVKQLEGRTYTLTEVIRESSLQQYLLDNNVKLDIEDYFISPNIPPYELANSLENWLHSMLTKNEKVIALIDTDSGWNSQTSKGSKVRTGVAFTESRIIWKNREGTHKLYIFYKDLEKIFTKTFLDMVDDSNSRKDIHYLLDNLFQILDNPNLTNTWIKFLRDLSHYAVSLNS